MILVQRYKVPIKAMIYSIAQNYTLTPGPRYIDEGLNSGEHFRQKVLTNLVKQAIQTGEKLTIDLDGTEGYGPSFLEESFGGLIRVEGIDYKSIMNILIIKSEDEPKYKKRILDQYLPEAAKHALA